MDDNNHNEFKDTESLHKLIRRGDLSTLKQQLLESKLDVEYKDDVGNTALLLAANLGKPDFVEILLEIGEANWQVINVFGQNALTLATYAGCIDCIKILLTKWTYKDYTESSLLPPVCVAAMRGHLDIVKFFCQLTPSPNSIQSVHGVGPLKFAEDNGHSEIVDLLLAQYPSRSTTSGKQKRKSSNSRAKPY